MDLNYLKKLIKIVDESKVNEVEIEEEGIKIKIRKSINEKTEAPTISVYQPPMPYTIPQVQPISTPTTSPTSTQTQLEEKPKPAEEPKVEKKYHEIKSPIVGTFYRAPSPDAEPYVKVGDVVSVGTVLCIVEAMKLMNEIESDVNGRVAKILVENAQAVEYGQTLFLIEPM